MQAKLILYMLIPNHDIGYYDIISEHPNRYEECSLDININLDLDYQLKLLYSRYLDLSSDFIHFVHLKPYVDSQNKILRIPFYCFIPYNNYEFKNSYKISSKTYAESIPDLQKILNVI